MQEMGIFSVIVLCHNNRYINRCIYSIQRQMQAEDELIVVDDHSDENCRAILQTLKQTEGIVLIQAQEKHGNRSYNRNLGARKATNDILIFVDGDIYFPEPVFHFMKDMLCLSGTAAVFSSIYGHSGNKFILDCMLGFDYLECLFDSQRWTTLKSYDFLQDRRDKKPEALINGEISWNYLYTSCVMTFKKAFEEIGGFDEFFEQWGAEDVDFGFRLARIGKLRYCRKLPVFHLPHPKDQYRDQLTNRANMYYMLSKYQEHIFELKIVYEKSMDLFAAYNQLLQVMRSCDIPESKLPCPAQCILYHTISQRCPNGLIEYTNSYGIRNSTELLGIALPFRTGQFETAYLSHRIFQYPYTLIPKIFQEFCRVAKNVLLEPVPSGPRIQWDTAVIKAFGRNSPFQKIYYSSNSLQDFSYENCGAWIMVKPAFHFYGGE